jgi:pSer/pThr/pTyr-binding forkhead associated (FHA) protein
MLAIAVNALYTTLRRRGTTRQLAGAIVLSVISALLLLPAILWYNVRFNTTQATISSLEIGLMLVYIAICGWVAPFGVTATYCLLARPRDSSTAGRLAGQQRKSTVPTQTAEERIQPPRRRPGVPVPYVYSADKPWGWLVYRNGNFTGQELALKHTIVSIGREEDNEVWLDDESISRYHAELAWDKGQVYVTDIDSLNGVLINGQRIRSAYLLQPEDELEIGSHRFILKHAQPQAQEDLSDPLLPQVRRRVQQRSNPGDPLSGPGISGVDFNHKPPAKPTVALSHNDERGGQRATPLPGLHLPGTSASGTGTTQFLKRMAVSERPPGFCIIRSGEMNGRSFLLDRFQLTLGCGLESDIIIPDGSIARAHIQFSRQPEGDYVRDQGSPAGTYVNGQPLLASRLLYPGDIIILGSLQLEYRLRAETSGPPTPPPPSSTSETPLTLPFTLRLPSRMKEN